jgi:hypothetical protein
MFVKDFDLFKQKYIKNCKTQSLNESVLKLYSYILENENCDSDFWDIGGGNDNVVRILEHNFSENAWKELQIDIQYWTSYQLEILAESIETGTGKYDGDELLCSKNKRNILLKEIIPLI